MITSYHNHTVWSDGSATIEAMVDGAGKAGFDELGISDHFALMPDARPLSWAMKPVLLSEYASEIYRAAANADGLIVRLGLEVDYFPETIERSRRMLAPYPFDYLIISVHFIDNFPIDMSAGPWKELSENSRNEIWRQYWQRLRAAAETGWFDILGHFDLPKKFGYFPTIDLTKEALAVLDAVAAAGMTIEINTAGWNKPVREAYPSLFYLKEARRRNIPLVINADAHKPADLAGHFDRARALAAEAGYSELVRFHQRRRYPYPLNSEKIGTKVNESGETYFYQVEDARQFAEKWTEAGPILEDLRICQLQDLDDETARKMTLDLFDMWRPSKFDDLGSGLVEQQRIFAKLRK
jgi:histidinol-phosphatase (PHP family)